MTDKLEFSRTWFRRVWAEEDESAIDELFVPDTEDSAKGLGTEPLPGPDEFKMFHRALLKLIKDVNIEIRKTAEDGAWMSILADLKAHSRETGKPVDMPCQVWVRIEDGKLREAHNNLDFIKLFEQLGLMPSRTIEHCLGGNRLALP